MFESVFQVIGGVLWLGVSLYLMFKFRKWI